MRPAARNPPSTFRVWPWTYRLSSEHRNTAASAILAGLLAHPAPEVRREAARSARRDGPELRRLLGDRDPTVASTAARSIWRLNPGPPLAEDEAERPPMRLVRP